MNLYDVYVPEFADEERVQFVTSVNSAQAVFLIEWWDELWHLTVTYLGEKRSGTLYPNTVYFPNDPTWRLSTVFIGEMIGLNDLSNMQMQMAVNG